MKAEDDVKVSYTSAFLSIIGRMKNFNLPELMYGPKCRGNGRLLPAQLLNISPSTFGLVYFYSLRNKNDCPFFGVPGGGIEGDLMAPKPLAW
jgi:hypothetical protein